MTAPKTFENDGRIDLTDIIFQHRNKAYGAYELRKHYNERVNKSMFITLTSITLIFLISWLIVEQQKIEIIHSTGKTGGGTILTNVPPLMPKEHNDIQTQVQHQTQVKPPINDRDLLVVKQNIIPILKPDSLKIPDQLANNTLTKGTNGADTKAADPNQQSSGSGTAAPATPVTTFTIRFAQVMPEFPGGNNALEKYLAKHINYTRAAIDAQAEGTILIDFVINTDGTVSDAKVMRDRMGYGCAQDALDVINNMPKWSPGVNNGQLVSVEVTVPINYKLDR